MTGTITQPAPTAGLRHVALYVKRFADCERFYVELLGMRVEWRPDPDNVYLTSGNDNLALHRFTGEFSPGVPQHLDHIGFILHASAEVDAWYEYLLDNGVRMKTEPQMHRDHARSFYCEDPDGNIVQMIYHPPIAELQSQHSP